MGLLLLQGVMLMHVLLLQGVMLTHANLLYQLNNLSHFLQPKPQDASLSLLPPWHIYERSCGYFIYSCGMKQVRVPLPAFFVIERVILVKT